MNYSEWTLLKSGDKVKDFTFGKGVIISRWHWLCSKI